MADDRFSATEVELLLELNRNAARGRARATSAGDPSLLASCNVMLNAELTAVSAVHQAGLAPKQIAMQVLRAMPVTEFTAAVSIEKMIEQVALKTLGDTGQPVESSEFDELKILQRGEARILAGRCLMAPFLGTEWINESEQQRIIVTAHRSTDAPAFTGRDASLLGLIKSASTSSVPRRLTSLPRRLQQVLSALEGGLSEKQCALELSVSRHTVHTYVKKLYKRFKVSSRGELLSLSLARLESALELSSDD